MSLKFVVLTFKNQLNFLAAVDRYRFLYEGPALERAIWRYNAYWLPLLAEHLENPVSDGPLVVPLDCEWIWHCHKLNPLRYKSDCEKLFGRVLGNHKTISSVQGTSKSKTKEIWNTMYPEEPYEMPRKRVFKLHPVSYCNDLVKLLGQVMQHDDTVPDKTNGETRDTGFLRTTKQWEETFGLNYWKAGAMYRGAAPTSVAQTPFPFIYQGKKFHAPDNCDNLIALPEKKVVELRYKSDCEKLFGRVLGNHNIISSVQGTSKSKTKEIWNTMYPEEPYELDHDSHFLDVSQKSAQSENFTSYDLVFAVKRRVSRPYASDDLFLQEALARYKGFLHLVMTNKKKAIKLSCVPTHDVDLMWHSLQLLPISYCNDLIKLLGQQWEETFGLNYWKAGAMYKGATPTPVAQTPFPFIYQGKKFHAPDNCDNLISLPEKKVVEVLLEFVVIKNLPEADKGNLFVSFSKKHPDMLFSSKRTLAILSEPGEKQAASFQCEPTGEFLFELMDHAPSDIPLHKSFKPLGSCSLSFQECLASRSQLSVKKLLPVVPVPGVLALEPILLQIGNVKHANGQTYVNDAYGNHVHNLKMRSHGSLKLRSINENGHLFELVGDKHKMVRLFAGRKLDYEPNACEKTRTCILSDTLEKEHRFATEVGCEDNMPNQATNSPNPIKSSTTAEVVVADTNAGNAKPLSQNGGFKGGSDSEFGNAVEGGDHEGGCGGDCGDTIITGRSGMICFETAKCGDEFGSAFRNMVNTVSGCTVKCGHMFCNDGVNMSNTDSG
ncbi:Glycine-rich domain-containing protein 1 [Bienertia sinuspersici]